jgi:hypothetical protein
VPVEGGSLPVLVLVLVLISVAVEVAVVEFDITVVEVLAGAVVVLEATELDEIIVMVVEEDAG